MNKVNVEFLRTSPFLKGLHDKSRTVFRHKSALLDTLRQESKALGLTEHLCPIITTNDCEGGGESFVLDASDNFFGKKSCLTVSAQLHLEACCANEKGAYTISPVFRAEKHDSKKHLAEFWMYEAEIAFPENLESIMQKCERIFFAGQKNIQDPVNLDISIQNIPRISYSEGINMLATKGLHLNWGTSLQSQHEIELCNLVNGPLFVTNFPAAEKAFYFKKCIDDHRLVESFDLLVPNVGEVAGGGLRETDYDILSANIKQRNIDPNSLQWYLDMRKYGNPSTGGFGIGIERLLVHFLKLDNVRDVVFFPRYKGLIKC